MLTLEMIQDAKKTLEGVARVTPLYESAFINPNANVFIKCENMQVTGSFKLRGAYVKTASLTEEEASKGVIACSAGNHAQGVALAAQKKGIKATICMPAGAPLAKVEATKSYGAEVVLVPGVYDDAAAKAVELQQEKGYTFLHPFNDEYVMAGQGTVGLEIMEKLPALEKNFQIHLIGRLQSNKVKYIIDHVCLIHSVDRLSLAQEIDRQAQKHNRVMPVLIQVSPCGEAQKGGLPPEELIPFLHTVSQLPGLSVQGLMAVMPNTPDMALLDKLFADMRTLFERARAEAIPSIEMKELSMGMSHDYELAARHGATMVRIGSALMGARDYGPQGQH